MADYGMTAAIPGAALFAEMAILGAIIAIAVYVYLAFTWMTIAKKLGYDKGWLAWIPIVQLVLLPILAKKHWAWVFILLIPIVNIIFTIIWVWNIYEQRKYPGWLSLIYIVMAIPFIEWLGWIGYLIIQGLVAWSDRK